MTRYYPPIVLKRHLAAARRYLRRMAEVTAETAHWYRPDDRLYLPCKHCKGLGCYTESKDGERRKFNHEDFSFEKGDRYEGSCPVCRGSRRREVTIGALRKAYRKIRKRACSDRGFDKETFDRMVKGRLWKMGKEETPTAWYGAAKRLAEDLEVDVKGL